MSVPETVQQQSRQGQVCENCKKLGHTKRQCFKLKTCYACSKVGHIAKHCRNKQQHQESISSSTGHTAMKNLEHSQFVALEASPRIYLKITLGGSKLSFLYDPGSQYSMIPRSVYDKLTSKPPMAAMNKVGL